MSTPKFAPGDRVKCIKASAFWFPGVAGEVYTVSVADDYTIKLAGQADQSCENSRFELYAKAGEFVAGDKVVAIKSHPTYCGGFKDGDSFVVKSVYTASFGEPGYVVLDNGKGGSASFSFFRLATAEEIAKTDAPKADAPKFKIGDIVVVHDEGYATNHGFKLNHNYTVEHVDGEDGDGCDLVLLKGKSKYDRIYAKRLSLVARPVVEEPKAEPAPWKFAVGDVVECVKGWEHYYTVGKRYTVKKSETGSLYVKRDDGFIGFGHLAQEGNFRIAIPAGGFRMGDIVELVQPISTGSNPGYTANVGDRFVVHSGNVEILRPDGQVFKGGGWGPDRFRLVERPHQDFFQKQAEPIDLAVKREPRVGRISTPWHKGSLLDLLFEAKTSAPRFEDLIGKPFTIKLPDFKFEAGETFFGKRSELGWAEPDPIKSGDRIIDNETTSTGRVIIVDGDYAWVLLDGKKRPVTRPLGNIELL